MNIPKVVLEHLTAEIMAAFPDFTVEDIKIANVTIDEDNLAITIDLSVSTSVKPEDFAEGYFGLTGKIRRSLASDSGGLDRFFPIITPSIGEEVYG